MAEKSDLKRVNQIYFLPNKFRINPCILCVLQVEGAGLWQGLFPISAEVMGNGLFGIKSYRALRSLWESIRWTSYLQGLWIGHGYVLQVTSVGLVNQLLLQISGKHISATAWATAEELLQCQSSELWLLHSQHIGHVLGRWDLGQTQLRAAASRTPRNLKVCRCRQVGFGC